MPSTKATQSAKDEDEIADRERECVRRGRATGPHRNPRLNKARIVRREIASAIENASTAGTSMARIGIVARTSGGVAGRSGVLVPLRTRKSRYPKWR